MSQAMRMLLAEGLISRQQLDRATFLQATRGGTIDYHLVAAGAMTSEQLVRFLVRRFPVVHWPLARFENLPQFVVDSISPRLAATLRIMPLSRSGNTLVLGLTDPSRHHAIQEAAHYSGAVVQPVVISHADMNWALRRYYPSVATGLAEEEAPVPLTKRVTREFESWSGVEPRAQVSDTAAPKDETAEAIPLVNRTVAAATRPLRPDSRPAAARASGPGVVKREAVFVGERQARPEPVRVASSREPAVIATPVRSAVPASPVRKVAPASSQLQPAPQRGGAAHRAVVVDPIRTIGEPSRRPARREAPPATFTSPTEYDSWTPPAALPAEPSRAQDPDPAPSRTPSQGPRRRGSHPLSRPRSSRPAAARESAPARAEPAPPAQPAIEAPKPRALTEGELIAAIDKAENRDRIIGLALEYLLRFAGRAVFFVVKSTEIRGFDIIGQYTNREAIRSFWIPAASPSTLRSVVTERQIHYGPLGSRPADAVLAAALGGKPERAMIVPVVIRDRVVGLLFADQLDISSPPWNRLERLAQAVGDNLARLITRGGRS